MHILVCLCQFLCGLVIPISNYFAETTMFLGGFWYVLCFPDCHFNYFEKNVHMLFTLREFELVIGIAEHISEIHISAHI